VSLLDFLLLLLVAAICGGAAQSIAGYSHRGLLTSIGLGFVGALIGSWLARALGVGEVLAVHVGGTMFPVVWSIIGAALFVTALHLVRSRATD
jgi:uncharacterized membrane protein YeaQ/YmgE (transglycosylase-associated protein family)